jgi:hypothetical protein
MKYYRVKPEYDNLRKYNGKKVLFDGIWIASELYTQKELEKLTKAGFTVLYKYFDPVEISKKQTYFFFGARFSNDTGVILPF